MLYKWDVITGMLSNLRTEKAQTKGSLLQHHSYYVA